MVYSLLALTMKLGLVVISAVSLVKVSVAYQQRHDRHSELASVLVLEASKLTNLQNRFDDLFTLGGRERFLDEQHQLISPNTLRVIWR